MKFKVNSNVLKCGLIALGVSSSQLYADNDWQGKSRDAWIDGKLESSYLLNTELNNFKIDTLVEDGVVTLKGSVPSSAHKELAEQIASNLNDVKRVDNDLSISDDVVAYPEHERNFSTRVIDATITASLKTQYAINTEIDAVDINIDTENSIVTLNGSVNSNAEKLLAAEIAEGKDKVSMVKNNLIIVQR